MLVGRGIVGDGCSAETKNNVDVDVIVGVSIGREAPPLEGMSIPATRMDPIPRPKKSPRLRYLTSDCIVGGEFFIIWLQLSEWSKLRSSLRENCIF